MAFDAGLLTAQDVRGHSVSHPQSTAFRPLERGVVVMGASALGAVIGFGVALAAGALPTWAVAVGAAPLFAGALHLGSESLREALRGKEWGASALAGALIIAMIAWPLLIFYAPPGTLGTWSGPVATMLLLAAFVLFSAGMQRRVYRSGALAVLVAVLAANQSLLTLMGT